jgi:CubicO group peptidase (beta-lactamase class C family)
VEDGGTVTDQTLFRIWSVTKPLTASALLRLVEAGTLSLDRPIIEYIPWFRLSAAGMAEQITLRMLLSHTAGLPVNLEEFGTRDPEGLQRYVREIVPTYPLVVPPGVAYVYSNVGYSVAAAVAEVVTGRFYPQIMADELFGPVGMVRTTFDPMVALTYPLAQPHDLRDEESLTVIHRFADNTACYPAGFALSTPADLARFALLHLNEGRLGDTHVLSASSVHMMHAPHVDYYQADGAGYGLGLEITPYRGRLRVHHNGGATGYGALFSLLPHDGIAVIVVFNRLGRHWWSWLTLVDHLLDQLLDDAQGSLPPVGQPTPTEPDRTLWPRFVGRYVGYAAGLVIVEVQEEGLVVLWNGLRYPMRARRADLYVGHKPDGGEEVSVGFLRPEEGVVEFVMINGSPCQRVSSPAPPPFDAAAWAAYAGTYTGSDPVTIWIDGEGVLLSSPWADDDKRYVPLDGARFVSDWGILRFSQSPEGHALLHLQERTVLTRSGSDQEGE